jgi:hypothetical protein
MLKKNERGKTLSVITAAMYLGFLLQSILTRNRYQLTAYRPEPSCLEESRLNTEVEGDVVSAHVDIRSHA